MPHLFQVYSSWKSETLPPFANARAPIFPPADVKSPPGKRFAAKAASGRIMHARKACLLIAIDVPI